MKHCAGKETTRISSPAWYGTISGRVVSPVRRTDTLSFLRKMTMSQRLSGSAGKKPSPENRINVAVGAKGQSSVLVRCIAAGIHSIVGASRSDAGLLPSMRVILRQVVGDDHRSRYSGQAFKWIAPGRNPPEPIVPSPLLT